MIAVDDMGPGLPAHSLLFSLALAQSWMYHFHFIRIIGASAQSDDLIDLMTEPQPMTGLVTT